MGFIVRVGSKSGVKGFAVRKALLLFDADSDPDLTSLRSFEEQAVMRAALRRRSKAPFLFVERTPERSGDIVGALPVAQR